MLEKGEEQKPYINLIYTLCCTKEPLPYIYISWRKVSSRKKLNGRNMILQPHGKGK